MPIDPQIPLGALAGMTQSQGFDPLVAMSRIEQIRAQRGANQGRDALARLREQQIAASEQKMDIDATKGGYEIEQERLKVGAARLAAIPAIMRSAKLNLSALKANPNLFFDVVESLKDHANMIAGPEQAASLIGQLPTAYDPQTTPQWIDATMEWLDQNSRAGTIANQLWEKWNAENPKASYREQLAAFSELSQADNTQAAQGEVSLQPKRFKAPGSDETITGNFNPKTGKYYRQSGEEVPNATLAESESGMGALYSQIDPKVIAKEIHEGRQSPVLSDLGRPASAAVATELGKLGVDLSRMRAEWNSVQRFYLSKQSTQQLRIRQSADVILQSTDAIDKLAEEWKAGGFRALNKAELVAAQNGVMGPEAARIATLLQAQITETVEAMANVYMGGNTPTDRAMMLAQTQLRADWSLPILKASTDLVRRNTRFRLNAIDNIGPSGVSPDSPYLLPRVETPTETTNTQTASTSVMNAEVVVVLKDSAGVERGRFKASPDKAAAAVASPPTGMTATIVR